MKSALHLPRKLEALASCLFFMMDKESAWSICADDFTDMLSEDEVILWTSNAFLGNIDLAVSTMSSMPRLDEEWNRNDGESRRDLNTKSKKQSISLNWEMMTLSDKGM